jgi:hypothetical protein
MIQGDNQQERLIDTVDLGWLVGFLESEGTFTISRHNKRKNGKYNLHPYVQATNSDIALINKAARAAKQLGVNFYIYHKKNTYYHIIHCGGYKRLARLLPQIIPYMAGEKRKKAEIILEYVNRRKHLPRGTPYSEQDLSDFELIKELNTKPKHRKKKIY